MRKYFVVLVLTAILLCVTIPTFATNADEYIAIDIQIENEITGDNPLQNEVFSYKIQPTQSEYPLPESSSVDITGAGVVAFKDLIFTSQGVYQYQIYQVSGENSDYDYDENIYEVTVYITGGISNNLESTVHVIKQGTSLKSASVTFINNYTNSAITDIPQTGDTFEFNYLILLIISSFALTFVFTTKKLLNKSEKG